MDEDEPPPLEESSLESLRDGLPTGMASDEEVEDWQDCEDPSPTMGAPLQLTWPY